MEEVIESTFSLLSFQHGSASAGTEKALEPIHLLALLDIKATWFKKWMVSVAFLPCLLVSLWFSLTYSVPSSRLSLSAWILQSDRGSQTPGEKIQVSGE